MHKPISFPGQGVGRLAAGLLWAAAGLAQASTASFSAVVDGTSQIVEIINPTGPVVRVETSATGSGSLGLLSYFSGDVIDLASGQGTGTNRFVTANGDQLFGSFTVQMVPGADPSLFGLIGAMAFNGGTGSFLGASGSGSFLGNGQFVSSSQALTHFVFEGLVTSVPEPGTGILALLGLGLGMGWLRRARGGWLQLIPSPAHPTRHHKAPSRPDSACF